MTAGIQGGSPGGRGWRIARAACAGVPGVVLMVAAVAKVAAPRDFALALFRHDLLPDATINAVAVFLPWLEIAAGVALIAVPRLRRGAALVAAALLGAFGAAVAINLLRGVEAACGCFSLDPAAPPAGWGHVALNLALMAACLVAAAGCRTDQAVAGRITGRHPSDRLSSE